MRTADGAEQEYRVRLDDLLRDGDISANVAMRPGDVVIIPETFFDTPTAAGSARTFSRGGELRGLVRSAPTEDVPDWYLCHCRGLGDHSP